MAIFGMTVSDAWLWLAGSLFLAVFWSNLVWVFSPWVDEDRSTGEFRSLPERVVYTIATWRFAPTSLQAIRLLYYVGLPFAALFWGRDALIGRFFGLKPLVLPLSGDNQYSALLTTNWLDWLHDFGWAAALGLGSAGLLLLAGWARRRALRSKERRGGGSRTSGWETIREAAYHEIHWAFYRNAPIVAFGLYWGIWIGVALVALEALANPLWRSGLGDPGRTSPQLLRASLAVVSSLLFLETQNLWLAITVHATVSWGLKGMYDVSSDAIPGRIPTAG